MAEQSKPTSVPVSSDMDYEVKLLSEAAGVDPSEARRLIEDAGSFRDAAAALGLDLSPKPVHRAQVPDQEGHE